MSDLVFRTTSTDRTVVEAVIEAAQVHGPGRVAVEDPVTGALSYRKLLIGAAVLGRKLMPLAEPGEAVGVMLPNANGAVVTILALMSTGRVPAMINFTSGPANVRAACRAAKIKTVITSRAFIEKGRLAPLVEQIEADVRLVYLEDVRATVAFRRPDARPARVPPPAGGAPTRRPGRDPVHLRLGGHAEGRRPVPPQHPGQRRAGRGAHRFRPQRQGVQRPAGVPFVRPDGRPDPAAGLGRAHLSLPLAAALPHRSRADLRRERHHPVRHRHLPGRLCALGASYDFRSLRYILAGAEPVKVSTRRVYMEKFGLRILEGYGVTETSPVLALNTPMFNKFGTVGRLLPGMEARLEPVPGVEDGGRLFVRGPNVMLGYLRAENPGVLERPPEGWHDTGDIVSIDPEGFITISGRAKRFAKIGGEMVSLAAVEMLAAELWPDALSGVATVPDPRKGERLILVTTKKDPVRSDLIHVRPLARRLRDDGAGRGA